MDIRVSSYLDGPFGEGDMVRYSVRRACAGQYVGSEVEFYVRSYKTEDGFWLIMESKNGAGWSGYDSPRAVAKDNEEALFKVYHFAEKYAREKGEQFINRVELDKRPQRPKACAGN